MAVLASAPNTTDWVAAIAACVTVGIYVVVAWFAKRQVDAARETREQAARDAHEARQAQLEISRAEARPYVYLRLDASEPPMLYLRLENVGKTAAANVRVTVTPPLSSTLDRPGQEPVAAFVEREWFLPPGVAARGLWDSAITRFASSLPLTYEVRASYDGPATSEHFEDGPYPLDISAYKGIHYSRPKGIDDLAKAVEGLRDTVQRWDHHGFLDVLVQDRLRFDEKVEESLQQRRDGLVQVAPTQEAPSAPTDPEQYP
ncbi:MAG: hypothetical protein M0013_12600 [Actinomycetota bacterium]|nr:hypothetical protein [Actinomycetota bacterium]